MSASTIPSRVRMGETAVRELAQRRVAMLATLESQAAAFAAECRPEYEQLGVAEAPALAELVGRCKAMSDIAPPNLLERTQSLLDSAPETGVAATELIQQVDLLEAATVERWERRESCDLVLDEIAGTEAVTIDPATRRWEPGRVVALARFADGERMKVSLPEGGGSPNCELAANWDAAGSSIGGATQEEACENQRAHLTPLSEEIEMTFEEEEEPAPGRSRSAGQSREARRST
jgi:hypothetical protein